MRDDSVHEWPDSTFDGLTRSMVTELRRMTSYPRYPIFSANLAREYEERDLSPGPVRAVVGCRFSSVRQGILVVTDEDVVAFGAGLGNLRESMTIAKEWIAAVEVRWRGRSGRITIECTIRVDVTTRK